MLARCNGTAAVVFQVGGVEVDPVAVEAAQVVDGVRLNVGGAAAVNQAVCGVVELAGRQVQGHARKDAAVVVEVGDVDVGLSGGTEGAVVIHVTGDVQLQLFACGDALPAAQAADVDFCPLGTRDGACAVEAVGVDFGVAGKDVAAVVDVEAIMQCGDVDFCRAGEGATIAEVVHPHLVACFAVDEAAVRNVRGIERKVACDDAAAVGKTLQQVQFEIHRADAAASAVQFRAVDGEFCRREQVVADRYRKGRDNDCPCRGE